MANNKSIDGANLQLALKQNNEKMKGYIDASHYDIKKYQKYVNTELDYGVFEVTDMQIGYTTPLIFSNVNFGNMELSENGFIRLQKNKTYAFHINLYPTAYNCGVFLVDTELNKLTDAITSANGSFIYHALEDIEVTFIPEQSQAPSISHIWSCVNVYEINRQIAIDPVEHINTTQGIEDTPVGHIISHMGTIVPKHYLICDGSEYNIADYPYLAQHIQDNFSTVNHFGGDGVNTFAVPNLISDETIENIAPVMTSNTTPTPYVVTESSFYNNVCKGWKAFTGTLTGTEDSWLTLSGKTAGWVTIDLGEEKMINGFALVCRNSPTNYKETFPKDFTFEGSNDGVNFTVLKTVTQESVSTLMERKVYMLGSQKYRYYKVNVTANNGGTAVGIGNIELLRINTDYAKYIKYEPTYFMNVYNTNYMHPYLYSEEEVVVGCWIDGKPIYEKTFTNLYTGSITSSTIITVENALPDIDKIIDTVCRTTGNAGEKQEVNEYLITRYSASINGLLLQGRQTYDNITDVNITIQYTKASDEKNSFTESMLKTSYVKLDKTYTEEEILQAVEEIVTVVNSEETETTTENEEVIITVEETTEEDTESSDTTEGGTE